MGYRCIIPELVVVQLRSATVLLWGMGMREDLPPNILLTSSSISLSGSIDEAQSHSAKIHWKSWQHDNGICHLTTDSLSSNEGPSTVATSTGLTDLLLKRTSDPCHASHVSHFCTGDLEFGAPGYSSLVTNILTIHQRLVVRQRRHTTD